MFVAPAQGGDVAVHQLLLQLVIRGVHLGGAVFLKDPLQGEGSWQELVQQLVAVARTRPKCQSQRPLLRNNLRSQRLQRPRRLAGLALVVRAIVHQLRSVLQHLPINHHCSVNGVKQLQVRAHSIAELVEIGLILHVHFDALSILEDLGELLEHDKVAPDTGGVPVALAHPLNRALVQALRLLQGGLVLKNQVRDHSRLILGDIVALDGEIHVEDLIRSQAGVIIRIKHREK
mmetsp:Transcript_13673/g.33113  ORF Transcript_13673/g.33113 Transcript_13673/m.33113 type:complete len:232 (+) Transcript_13673:350-1045(+)